MRKRYEAMAYTEGKKVNLEMGKEDHYLLPQYYPFSSPSTTAPTFHGKIVNGQTECKDAIGNTLEEIQEENTK